MNRPGRRTLYEGDERCYIEVKNTTLALEHGERRRAAFPDAVTERGRKHLFELMAAVAGGHRAAMVFCAQRSDCDAFVPADAIDPAYGKALREAVDAGVEAYALATATGPRRARPWRRLSVLL
ncbi:MAG: DNA/RNA nuclease SfsA [Myxococcota bacterium]